MRDEAVELAYQERGQGKVVVFVHGFPFDHTIWEDVAKRLEGETRMILPDLRGFGKSPVPEGVYSMRLMAEDLAALLDRLEIQKAVIVGHSMGGYVSLAFAQAYPDRTSGLALISSQAAADTPERRAGRFRLADEIKRKGLKAVVTSNLERYSPHLEVRERIKPLMLNSPKKGAVAALKGMAERPDMLEFLSHLQVPGVVVAGSADALISPEKASEMAQMMPRGWMVEVPGGGHMPMFEAPEIVAQALLDLLARV